MKKDIKFKLVFKRHGNISGVDAPDYVFVVKTLDQIADSGFLGYFDNESYYTLVATLRYTGLKDKKGTDIFEGDIVRWDDNSKGAYWRVCKVVWETSGFKLIGHTFNSKTPKDTSQKVIFSFGSFIYQYDRALEIIGNIYENKKLA